MNESPSSYTSWIAMCQAVSTSELCTYNNILIELSGVPYITVNHANYQLSWDGYGLLPKPYSMRVIRAV